MSKSRIYFIAIGALCILGVFYFTSTHKNNKDQKEITLSLRDYIVSSFVAELPEINRGLPRKIDENTMLVSIQYDKNVVSSTYKLIGNPAKHHQFQSTVAPVLQKQACLNEAKKRLLGVDVEFLEIYKNSSDQIVFQFELNHTICAQFS